MKTLLAIGVLGSIGLPVPLAAPVLPVPLPPPLVVDWSMPDRFGVDADGDGLMDLPNTAAYVHNRVLACGPCPDPGFRVSIAVSGPAAEEGDEFSWRITGPSGETIERHGVLPRLEVLLPEGPHRVEVEATLRLSVFTARVRGAGIVAVQDVLVVAIGDSYAAGEGNPEVRRGARGPEPLWGDGGDPLARAGHARHHRSTVAWPARLALALERDDPRSSVTFVNVASSGARIDWGILTAQGSDTTPQLEQVADLIGGRTIDLLLVQEGGNSIGFARLVRALVEADPLFDPVCYRLMVDQAIAATADGDWRRGTALRFRLPFDWSCVPEERTSGAQLPGVAGLPDAFRRLDAALGRFDIARVVLVGYPDPTGGGADGAECREIVGDVTPPLRFHEISREEGRRGVAEVLTPLNATLATIAADLGWDFVGGVAEAFAAGHGYCAPWPSYRPMDPAAPGFATTPLDSPDAWYRNPGLEPFAPAGAAVTWYRTAGQSVVLQGPGAAFSTEGTLHPNEVGHGVIARLVWEHLQGAG